MLAFHLSEVARMVMLLATVKRPIPTGLRGAQATMMRLEICFFASSVLVAVAFHSAAAQPASSPLPAPVKSVLNQYCVRCHDADVKKGGLDLERISRDGVTQHSDEWEQVIRKLRARQMPPIGKERPADKTYDDVVTRLSSSLDRAAEKYRTLDAPKLSAGSTAPNTKTSSASCWRWTSTRRHCCRRTTRATASTT